MIDYSKMTKEERQLVTVHLANKVIEGSRHINILSELFLYFVMGEIDSDARYPYRIVTTRKKYAKFRGLPNGKFKFIRKQIDRIIEDLNANPLKAYDDEAEEYDVLNWVTSINLRKDKIYVNLTPEVGAFLLYKKGQSFTKVLQDISGFKSTGTVAIKEMIEIDLYNKWKKLKIDPEKKLPYIDKEISDIKFKAGIESSYKNLSDFKRFFLDRACNELKDLNFPIQFEYDMLSEDGEILETGRRGATQVRFYIIDKREEMLEKWETDKEQQTTVDEVIDAAKQEHQQNYKKQYQYLTGWGIGEEKVYDLIEEKGIEKIQQAIDVVQSTPNVKNPSGLFLKALQGDWQTAQQKDQEKKREARQKNKARVEAEKQKEAAEKARKRAYYEERKAICDKLLTEEKGLEYFYEKAKNYITRTFLHFHLDKTPEQVYHNGGMTLAQMIYAIEQEYPQSFEELHAKCPDLVVHFELVE